VSIFGGGNARRREKELSGAPGESINILYGGCSPSSSVMAQGKTSRNSLPPAKKGIRITSWVNGGLAE